MLSLFERGMARIKHTARISCILLSSGIDEDRNALPPPYPKFQQSIFLPPSEKSLLSGYDSVSYESD